MQQHKCTLYYKKSTISKNKVDVIMQQHKFTLHYKKSTISKNKVDVLIMQQHKFTLHYKKSTISKNKFSHKSVHMLTKEKSTFHTIACL